MVARDALNLYLEADHTSANLIDAVVVDSAAGSGPGIRTHADAVAFARSVMHLDPIFTQRLHRYPLDLQYPYWVTDAAFDPADHVEVISQESGDVDIVRRVTVDVAQRRFDTSRGPLWALTFLVDLVGAEGVPDGGTVLVVTFHHCAIDGIGAADLISRMLSQTSASRGSDEADEPCPPLLRAVSRIPRDVGNFVGDVVRHARAEGPAAASSAPVVVPATRFNGEKRGEMVWSTTWFDLAAITPVTSARDVTVNDVLTTVISLALSEYLRERGELPSADLTISMPMSTRSMRDETAANQLAMLRANLHTTTVDPADRLAAVHDSVSSAKNALIANMAQSRPPHPLKSVPSVFVGAIGALTRTPPAYPKTAPLGAMSSNVNYGAAPLELAGAPVVGCYGVLPTVRGVHLAHAIRTVGSTVSLSVTSNADAMPDAEHYIELVHRGAANLGVTQQVPDSVGF